MNTKQRNITIFVLVMNLVFLACMPNQLLAPTRTVTPSLTPSPTITLTPSPTPQPLYTAGRFYVEGATTFDAFFSVNDNGVIDEFRLRFDFVGGTCTLTKPDAETWTLDNNGTFSIHESSYDITIKVNGKFGTVTYDVRSCKGTAVTFSGETTLIGRPLPPYIGAVPGTYTGTNVSFAVRNSGEGDGTIDNFKMRITSQCGDVIDLDEVNSNLPPEYWILNGSEFTYFTLIQPFYDVSIQVVGKTATIVWMITCAWPNPNTGSDSGSITDIQWAP